MVYETIQDETVLVDLSQGIYFSVAGAGSEIWVDLMAGRTLEQILERLSREYDAPPEQIETEVRAFLDSLAAEGLVLSEPSPEDAKPPRIRLTATSPDGAAKQPWQAPQLQKYVDMQELLLLDAIHESDDLGLSPSPDPPQ